MERIGGVGWRWPLARTRVCSDPGYGFRGEVGRRIKQGFGGRLRSVIRIPKRPISVLALECGFLAVA